MKHLYVIIIALLSIYQVNAQKGYSGQYKIFTTGDTNDITKDLTLTLNCNNTFVQNDSIYTRHGKWSIKNPNRLELEFDSIAESEEVDITNTKKLEYSIENGRIHSRIVTNKEYKEFKKSMKKYYREASFDSFDLYKEKAQMIYFKKYKDYSCN